jgi:hypothetical protein
MISEIDPKAEVAFLSDSSEKSPRYTEFYLGFKKKNPIIAKRMVGITHGEEEHHFALQAADLIAAEAKKCYDVIFETGKELREVPLLEKFTTVATIPRERIAEIVANQAINRR